MTIPTIPVGYLHLEQLDTSLNPAILDLWPSGTLLDIKAWRDSTPAPTTGDKERRHLADRVLALHRAATSLSLLCFRAFGGSAGDGRIEGCRNMVERLARYRRRADGLLEEDPVAAAVEYHSALEQLRPWCSTDLLFRREDVFALGVAQLDGGCWVGLASALIILGEVETAAQCARIVLDMRYAEPSARIRAKTVLRSVREHEHEQES